MPADGHYPTTHEADLAIHPRSPWEFVPASARKVSVSFSACRSGDAWAVYQDTRWKDSDGWDGDCTRLASGLTEAGARRIAAELNGEAAEQVAAQAQLVAA